LSPIHVLITNKVVWRQI